MNDELHTILNRIGYFQAIQYNRSLFFWRWKPNDRGAMLFKDKPEAVVNLRALKNLAEALDAMSPNLVELLNNHAKISDDWDQGREPLVDVVIAVGDLTDMAEKEKNQFWSGRGASRRVAGEDIARHLAEIFVLGTGKMPGAGAKENGDPSGAFPNAVHSVFSCIGIPDHYRRPCQKAVAWLKADDNREFNRLLQMRKTKGKRISLLTGSEQN